MRSAVERARRTKIAVAATAVGVVGPALVGGPRIFATTGLLALGLANVVLFWWVVRVRPGSAAGASSTSRLLVVSWNVVALVGVHNFVHRDTAAVVSQVNLQTGVELVVFGLVGLFAVDVVLTKGMRIPKMSTSLLVLPVWVMASAAWSDAPLYALARGAEFVVLALLAMATAAHGAEHRDAARQLLLATCRTFVRVTSVLVVVGIAFGPVFVRASEANLQRFTWAGVFPTSAAIVLGLAMAVLVVVRPAELGIRGTTLASLGLLIAWAIYANQTRTALAGVLLCALLRLVVQVKESPHMATLTGSLLIAVGVVGAGVIWDYVLRDGDASRLWTLNGRTDVWPVAVESLDGVVDWITGLGYGASRVVFLDELWYASTAHNSFIAALVDLGLVGVALVVGVIVAALRCALRVRRGPDPRSGLLLLSLTLFTVVAASTSDAAVTPGIGSATLYLVCAVGSAIEQAPRHVPGEGATDVSLIRA